MFSRYVHKSGYVGKAHSCIAFRSRWSTPVNRTISKVCRRVIAGHQKRFLSPGSCFKYNCIASQSNASIIYQCREMSDFLSTPKHVPDKKFLFSILAVLLGPGEMKKENYFRIHLRMAEEGQIPFVRMFSVAINVRMHVWLQLLCSLNHSSIMKQIFWGCSQNEGYVFCAPIFCPTKWYRSGK